MKVKLVEAPNDIDLSKLQTPKPKDVTVQDNNIEGAMDTKAWNEKILNATQENNLDVVQEWLDAKVTNKMLKNSSLSFLQLVYDWIKSFNTTDVNINPLVNQMLYVTNELGIKITYDSLVTINNAYDGGIVNDKNLMGSTRLGIFQNMEFWKKQGREQDEYLKYYVYLGDVDGVGKVLDAKLKEYKADKVPQITVFETSSDRMVGNLNEKSPISLNWWRKSLNVFRDAIVFIGNARNIKEYMTLKLRPLDDIQKWISLNLSNASNLPRQKEATKSQVRQLKKTMQDKNLSVDDVKTIYSVVDALKGDVNAVKN